MSRPTDQNPPTGDDAGFHGTNSPQSNDCTALSVVESSQDASGRNRSGPADVGPVLHLGSGDEAREVAIIRAGKLAEFFMIERAAALSRHEADGCFAAMGDADAALHRAHDARRLMEALILGRRPEYVALLDRDRGLDLPAVANDATTGQ